LTQMIATAQTNKKLGDTGTRLDPSKAPLYPNVYKCKGSEIQEQQLFTTTVAKERSVKTLDQ
jgi:hypothetical protein